MTIRTRITSILATVAAALVAPFKALRTVVLTEPHPVKRRAALILSLILFLPIIFAVGAFKVLRYLWIDVKDNVDYVFGDLPHDIRDRWNGVGTRRALHDPCATCDCVVSTQCVKQPG